MAYVWPVNPAFVPPGGEFGSMVTDTGPRVLSHSGVDWARNAGEEIKAAHGGTVVKVGTSATAGWGYYIWVKGDDGKFYGYAHMVAKSQRAIGSRVEAGALLGHVGSSGDVTGAHLHFTIGAGTQQQAFDLVRSTLINPVTYLQSKMQALTPTQRRVTVSELKRRNLPSTASAIDGPPLLKGEVGNFDAYTIGMEAHSDESGVTTKLWARGISGDWFSFVGLEPAYVDGLPFVENPDPAYKPPVVIPKRTVRPTVAVNIRDIASTAGKIVGEAPAGSTHEVKEFAKGQTVTQNGVQTELWYKVTVGGVTGFSSAVGWTVADATGMTEVDGGLPKWPTLPLSFTADVPCVTRVLAAHWANFENEYSVPDPAMRKGFPASPESAVIHDFGDEGVNTFQSVLAWFQSPSAITSAHFVVSGKNIVQMVPLSKRAYHAGPNGNGFVGIEVDPIMDADTIASVRLLLTQLRDEVFGYQLKLMEHNQVPGVSTLCGDDVDLAQLDVTPVDPTLEYRDFLADIERQIEEFTAAHPVTS